MAPYPHSDLDLARRLERVEGQANAAFVQARAAHQPESRAGCTEVAGAFVLFDGPESPLSQTFGLGLFGDVTGAHLDRIECFYSERGAPCDHEISPLAGPEMGAMLAERGYVPIEHASVLYQPLPALTTLPVSEAWTIRRALPEEAEAWAALAARGWSDLAEAEAFMRSIGRLVVEREGSLALFAERGGRPQATGALSLHDGVALFAGASTVPAARGQGAQTALLHSRLEMAAEAGCDLAAMVTLPGSASQRNAERAGFRVAYTRTKWRLNGP